LIAGIHTSPKDLELTENIDLKRTVFGVSGIIVTSKILGFVREMVIAERFGTSLEYDVYLIAVAIPIFFNLVIVRSVNFLTVPLLSKKILSSVTSSDKREISSFFNSLLMVVFVIILAVILSAPLAIKAVGSNLQGESYESAILYYRLFSLVLLFTFLESFFRSALNVKKKFAYPAAGNVILNVVLIFLIYILSGKFSVASILIGLLVGSFIQVVFLALKLLNFDYLNFFSLKLFNRDVRKAMLVGAVIVAVEMLSNTYFLIDRYFASGMAEGVVSALNYCSMLVMLPVSIIGLTVASVSFPFLSERAAANNKKDFTALLNSVLKLSLAISIPCGVFYMVFAKEITAAAYFRGAFNLKSLLLTSEILTYLAPYLICLFLYTILIQACYSIGYQKAILVICVISVLLKFFLTWLLTSMYDYIGIPIAASIVQSITILSLISVLVYFKRLKDITNLLKTVGKLIIASTPIVVVGLYYLNLPEFHSGMNIIDKLRVVPAAIFSFIGFTLLGYLLKIDQVQDVLTKFKRIKRG
jgi:putative peptidoglycan lipid II flippase